MCMYSKAALAAENKKKKEEKAMQKAKAKQAVADQALVDKAAAKLLKRPSAADLSCENKVKLEPARMASFAAAPSFSVERSRNQVQLRTGHKGPGQNLALEFARHGGEAATRALAEKWLAAELRDPQGASGP